MSADTMVEYGGVLVGTVHVSGEYVFVIDAIPLRPPSSASANFTLNPDAPPITESRQQQKLT